MRCFIHDVRSTHLENLRASIEPSFRGATDARVRFGLKLVGDLHTDVDVSDSVADGYQPTGQWQWVS
eukprot:CAMPEP_0114281726 /NCGR_PEP_ID=MMETSP0059-20121206/3166_1 /TAXON_ID=36894 /ORGANISM="Pyramimonas parkeae, Strain CCMP726" /LENGTH=66 /DNA_ID=CAMNT_0001402295 /DNA_START=55 /DNA_END=255 /DNA_ORIENTATION=-